MLIDLVTGILLVVAIFKGFSKGLIVALFSLVAWIVGLAAALKLSEAVAVYLGDSVKVSEKWLPFISFILVFIGVVLLIRLGAGLVEKTVQVAMMGWINRLGGMLFYALIYIIIFSIILFYLVQLQLLQPGATEDSQIYPYIAPVGPWAIEGFGKLVPWFRDMFGSLEIFFEDVKGKMP